MPRFRRANPASTSQQCDLLSVDEVRAVVAEAEEVFWEVFQGQLLDAPMTTRRQTFEAWHVCLTRGDVRSGEPVLSVRLDSSAGCLFVTRAIHCHAWEGYHAGDNVYLSRETRKWVRELVGTIPLARHAGAEEFRDELIGVLFHALVGTSRLPLTSVEAPLPAFSLGELAYVFRPDLRNAEGAPLRTHKDLIEYALLPDLCWLEKAKLLETLLRATPWDRLTEAGEMWMTRWRDLGH